MARNCKFWSQKPANFMLPIPTPPALTDGRNTLTHTGTRLVAISEGLTCMNIILPLKKRGIGLPTLALAALFCLPASGFSAAGPQITTQPQSQTVLAGTNAVFTVVATGQDPLTYQWWLNYGGDSITWYGITDDGTYFSGAQTAQLTISNVGNAFELNYRVTVTDRHGNGITSLPATLTVDYPPSFFQSPQSVSTNVGSSVTFACILGGGEPFPDIRWYHDGVRLTDAGRVSGSSQLTLSVSNAQPADAGNYFCVASNQYASATSQVAQLIFYYPPTILSHPQNQTVIVGQNAAFSVGADGTQPLRYQLRFNGTDAYGMSGTGGTNWTFNLPGVQPAQAGTYSIVVSNDYGFAVSSNAVLAVLVPVSFTASPPSQMLAAGSPITLSATATGSLPITYQWFFNGTPLADDGRISGSASNVLSIADGHPADNGDYWVVAANGAGAVTSTVANISVLLPPTFTLQPAGQTLAQGDSADFHAAVSGGQPLSYQWYFNGNPLADGGQFNGSATTNLTLSSLRFTNGGSYVLVASNLAGSATSSPAVLAVLSPPEITVQPAGQNVLTDSNTVISATVIGTQPISYRWFANNSPLTDDGRIAGSATASLLIGGAQTNDTAAYFVVATNDYGAVTSSVANLTVWAPVTITQPPVSQTNAAGSMPSLTVAAEGSAPLGYQWFFNNAPLADNSRISGSATAALSISNALTSDTGNYTVIVTNLLSTATSSVATLTVLVPPGVATQPPGRSTPLGLPTTFSAVGSGADPLAYQWRLNGADLPGATNTSYTIAAVSANDLGAYQFVVSNAVGVAVSSNAWLTVGPLAAWGQNTYNQCLVPPWLTNVTSFGCAYNYSLASLSDGTIAAWGNVGANTNSSFTNVVAVSAGQNGALALHADGTVIGAGYVNPLSNKAYPSNVVAVAAGYAHGLALRAEGTVTAWGTYSPQSVYWPVIVPAGLSKVTAIAAGYQHDLALRSDGTVVAWGYGTATNVPIGLSNVVAIAAGSMHSLALKADGTVVAWGSGGGTNIPAGLSNVIAIGAGNYFDQRSSVSFAVKSNGTAVAWGVSAYTSLTNLPSGLSNVVAVAGGAFHALALVNDGSPQILQPPAGGTAWSGSDWALRVSAAGAAPLRYQWQFNGVDLPDATNATLLLPSIQAGSAGNYRVTVSNSLGAAASVPVPLAVADSAPFLLTSPAPTNRPYVGNSFVLSAAAAGSGPMDYQWQLNGTDIPGATNTDFAFDAIGWTNGGNYSFIAQNSFGAVTSSVAKLFPVSVVIWGQYSPYFATNVPLNLSNAIAIMSSMDIAMALRSDGTVTNWGYITSTPADVSNVVEIAVGGASNLQALRKNGQVRSWNANVAFSNAVAGISNIVGMEADFNGSTFLKADGSIARVLSTGSIVAFPQLTNVVALSKFYSGFAAVRADGTVFTYAPNSTPPPAWATSNVLDIALESSYGAVLKRDGVIQTWGGYLNYPYQTNFPSMTTVSVNAGVKVDGTVTPWSWTPNYPSLTNVPYGLSHVGAVDGSPTTTVALLVRNKFSTTLLPKALDTDALVVSSRGSPRWIGQTNLNHDGVSAAQSAVIGNNTASSMRMWVEGPVTVSFWWKVSSAADHGTLSFSAGSVVLTNISGEVDWQQCTVDVPSGNQILQWTYAKDGEPAAGQDAGWVDQLQLIPQPPTISLNPASQSVVGPTNVALNVVASGTPPMTYRWWKDGALVPGAAASSLTLLNAGRTNSGTYWLVITNAAGNVTSSNAVLDVRVPQKLSTPTLQPDGTLLLASGDADGGPLSAADLANLQVQVSTNLVDWTTLPGAITLTNGMIQLQDDQGTNALMHFYRILENW